jgi:hypothetical protein
LPKRCGRLAPGGSEEASGSVVLTRKLAVRRKAPLVASRSGRDPVVAVAVEEDGEEAVEVEGDLLRLFRGADPDHGERQIPRRPGGKGVGNILRQPTRNACAFRAVKFGGYTSVLGNGE